MSCNITGKDTGASCILSATFRGNSTAVIRVETRLFLCGDHQNYLAIGAMAGIFCEQLDVFHRNEQNPQPVSNLLPH